MCGATEIYCSQSHCHQPIGWHIVEPCEAFVIANSANTQQPAGTAILGWNWNTSTCGCSVPRVVRRQRCRYRSCITCARSALSSAFMTMQHWADVAKEYPDWWRPRRGDDLLLRRTKTRLRKEYGKWSKDNGKRRTVDFQQAYAATNRWTGYPETPKTISHSESVFAHLPDPSWESFPNNHSSLPNSRSDPPSSATVGQAWYNGLGERLSTVQGLPRVAGALELGQEAPSAANTPSIYPSLEYQPDVWTACEPPQPALTMGQVWNVGDDTARLLQPQHEGMQQASDVNFIELNLEDPFWNNILSASGDGALENGTNGDQIGNNNGAHFL
ncbi:hypothetical protein V8C35DRAFT_251089 [Trichoderma chlorosporum]